MKIGIIGYGVVGGATGEMLKRNHRIIAYDKYKKPHNLEIQLERIAREAEVVFVCVPTPMKPSGEIDYTPIHDSLKALRDKLTDQAGETTDILVVIRSTAVSGTSDDLALQYGLRIAVNPEFLTEKNAKEDMENTDHVVLGANDQKSLETLEQVYRPIFPNAKYIHVNRRTAEMIKYAANVMLALQIGGANELFGICEAFGVDYQTVAGAILLDPRIGRNIQVPGHDGDRGFGGKCLPKDLNALIYKAREAMYRPYLLEELWRLNERIRENRDWENIAGATSGSLHKNEE